MEDSTAEGLAGAGALLAAASLAAPWYSVGISGPMADQVPTDLPSLGSQSGWEALGNLHWLVLALALLAGWRGAARIQPLLPGLAAIGLLIVAGFHYVSPPDAGGLLAGQLPTAGAGPIETAFAEGLISSFTKQLGLELNPAIGLAMAGAGAAAAVYGALNRSQAAVT